MGAGESTLQAKADGSLGKAVHAILKLRPDTREAIEHSVPVPSFLYVAEGFMQRAARGLSQEHAVHLQEPARSLVQAVPRRNPV